MVLKAQSPLASNDTLFYPLTTYDQIIMPDGDRWNGEVELDPNIVSVDLTNIDQGEMVLTDADLLGGIPAKDYALKTDNPLPTGGTTGQILAKMSNEDFATHWIDAPIGSGGSIPEEGGNASNLTVDDIYPVGSIYMSVDSTSPASRFANTTWEQLKDRFLIGAGGSYSNGATGGAATVTIAEKNLPWNTVILNQYGSALGNGSRSDSNSSNAWTFGALSDAYKNTSKGLYVDGTNYNVAHDNMPPYLSVYMWKRVS